MPLDLLLILLLGVAAGWLARRWRFPAAVAQVLMTVLCALLAPAAMAVLARGSAERADALVPRGGGSDG